jgi:hypothetical protein
MKIGCLEAIRGVLPSIIEMMAEGLLKSFGPLPLPPPTPAQEAEKKVL